MNEGSGYGLESVDRHRQEVVASIREVLGSGPDVEALVEPAVRSTARRARQQELGG